MTSTTFTMLVYFNDNIYVEDYYFDNKYYDSVPT